MKIVDSVRSNGGNSHVSYPLMKSIIDRRIPRSKGLKYSPGPNARSQHIANLDSYEISIQIIACIPHIIACIPEIIVQIITCIPVFYMSRFQKGSKIPQVHFVHLNCAQKPRRGLCRRSESAFWTSEMARNQSEMTEIATKSEIDQKLCLAYLQNGLKTPTNIQHWCIHAL